jgi:hypothetical protein
MGKKRYISVKGVHYTFPVVSDKNKTVWVVFDGHAHDYSTEDASIQRAIEASDYFKSGLITSPDGPMLGAGGYTRPSNSPEPDIEAVKEKPVKDIKVFGEVTDVNGAVAILAGAPYMVGKAKLRTPDDIRREAETRRLSFPNLKTE